MTFLGTLIRQRREALGLNQDELGARVGINRAYVSQIETGNKKYPRKYITAIADALDIDRSILDRAAGKIGTIEFGPARIEGDRLMSTSESGPVDHLLKQLLSGLTDLEVQVISAGCAISGTVIRQETYFDLLTAELESRWTSNPLGGEDFARTRVQSFVKYVSDLDSHNGREFNVEESGHFLYLNNAQVVGSGSQSPCLWRVRLDTISGWTLVPPSPKANYYIK